MNYSVYTLEDPRDGAIRYVGITKDVKQRYYYTVCQAILPLTRMSGSEDSESRSLNHSYLSSRKLMAGALHMSVKPTG